MEAATRSLISVLISVLNEQAIKYYGEYDYYRLEDQIFSLRDLLQYLITVYTVSKSEDLNLRIQGVVDNIWSELSTCRRSSSLKDGMEILISDLEGAVDHLLEMTRNVFINPETMEFDVIFPNFLPDLEYFLGYRIFLREIISKMSLNVPLSTLENLLFLQGLVAYVASVGVNIDVRGTDIFATLHSLIDRSTFLVHSCIYPQKMGEMELALYHNVSNLLEKDRIKEIYVEVVRASNVQYFTGSVPLKSEIHLLNVLIGILKGNTSFVHCLYDSSMKLHDELDKLQNFLKDLPRQVTTHKLSYLVRCTEAIISPAIPIIYSHYDDNENKNLNNQIETQVNGSIQVLSNQIEQIQVGGV